MPGAEQKVPGKINREVRRLGICEFGMDVDTRFDAIDRRHANGNLLPTLAMGFVIPELRPRVLQA
jgi:hypothetical protein